MNNKKVILRLLSFLFFIFFLLQSYGCSKNTYYFPESFVQGNNEDALTETDLIYYSCEDATGLVFKPYNQISNEDYLKGFSSCQENCLDLNKYNKTWKSYGIKEGNEWCKSNNDDSSRCCAYCPEETHYCPIIKSCVSDSDIKEGLQWEVECPYLTLSWDKDEKAISYEIIPFYDKNKDGTEDGKCDKDVINTKERYFYYNLESSECAAYYTGNIKFQIIPQYLDSVSIDSYNTDWIDVSKCQIDLFSCFDLYSKKTLYDGECSEYKPYLCNSGELVKDCSECSCPDEWVCWINAELGSVCNPKWLYNYNNFNLPNDKSFIEVVKNPSYDEIPSLILVWMKKNFEYEKHPDFEGTYSPYEMYLKKKGVCRDMATFATYVLNFHKYESYLMVIVWKDNTAHMVPVYKNEDHYNFFSNNNYHVNYLSSFSEIADEESWLHGKKTIDHYMVWNYDGLLVEKPVYKGREYDEYEDFSKYEWI